MALHAQSPRLLVLQMRQTTRPREPPHRDANPDCPSRPAPRPIRIRSPARSRCGAHCPANSTPQDIRARHILRASDAAPPACAAPVGPEFPDTECRRHSAWDYPLPRPNRQSSRNHPPQLRQTPCAQRLAQFAFVRKQRRSTEVTPPGKAEGMCFSYRHLRNDPHMAGVPVCQFPDCHRKRDGYASEFF